MMYVNHYPNKTTVGWWDKNNRVHIEHEESDVKISASTGYGITVEETESLNHIPHITINFESLQDVITIETHTVIAKILYEELQRVLKERGSI